MADKSASDKRKETLLETAKKRWKVADAAEAEQRSRALEDIRFAEGDQWPPEMRERRRLDGRPCLTINRIPQFVQHITNEERQNPTSLQINPVGSGADKDTADVLQGLVRHIENQSNADEAYSNAFDYAVKGGWGFVRVITEYADELSFEQEIYIKKVENPFSVYLDPGGNEGDASDSDWGFVVCDYTKDQYKDKFPDSKWSGDNISWVSTGDSWMSKESIRVAEYFYREMREEEIVQTSDGQVYLKKVLPKLPDGEIDLPAGITIQQTRKTSVPFVKWALINNEEVLDEQEWAGKWIPIVRVIGQMTNINGERVYKGIVRDARDPQQQLNFMETAATEAIALAPKAPYIVTPKMIQGYEKQWSSMNTQNRPFLYVNEASSASPNGGMPVRNQIEPPIQAMMLAVRQASDDLKSTAGIYDAALGAGANDVSGKAILARQQQSQISAFHFGDNLQRAKRQIGRILIDLIPFVYNTPNRIVRIIGEDGTQENVTVNAKADDAGNLPAGVQQVYDLTTGKYDVTVSTGPSYQTKRQEAVDTQLQLLKTDPNLWPIIGDLVVGNMDIPGAREIADRLKTMLPPAIAAMDQKQANVPPEVQQTIVQLQTQLQQAQQAAQAAAEEAKYGIQKQQMQLESDERIALEKLVIEREKIQASIVTAELAAKSRLADSDAQREMDWLQSEIDRAHEVGMNAVQHEQAQQMQQQEPQEPTQ